MACLNPSYVQYTDRYTGLTNRIQVPCGRCINCQHVFQRSWTFRIKQTANACNEFIYDTLTLDDAKFTDVLDYTEIKDTGTLVLHTECLDDVTISPSSESLRLLEHYDFRVPYASRHIISRWIKLGKDRYNKVHRRAIKEGKMQKLNLRYVIVQEYGPLWGRSHYHCMFFGISYADYVRFFAKRWRALYGFTKTKLIRSVNGRASASRISGYLTKYFTKQDECPLVRDGFLPHPFRLISHGIGVEYLKHNRLQNFGRFFGVSDEVWDACCSTTYRGRGDETNMYDKSSQLVGYLSSVFEQYLRDLRFHGYALKTLYDLMDALTLAYDDGIPLGLPRYYRYKLLDESHKKLEKSVAYVVCSHYLYEFNRLREQQEIEKLYLALNPGKDLVAFRKNLKLGAIYSHEYAALKLRQAADKANQRAIEHHNFLVRPFHGNGIQSNLSFYEL